MFRNQQEKVFPATVVFIRDDLLGAQFDSLSLRQRSELVRLTFSRADIWASTGGDGQLDMPLAALREVALIGMRGIYELFTATLLELRNLLPANHQPSPTFENNMEK